MLVEIITGINDGVERAALNFAEEFGIKHRGWVPGEKYFEDDRNTVKYQRNMQLSQNISRCIEKNVLASDATLLITSGRLFGGSEYYKKMAVKHKKKWFHVNLDENTPFQIALTINHWLRKHDIRVLTISGSKKSEMPGIQKTVEKILNAIWEMTKDEKDKNRI